jgi:fumarate hydratase subunit beta
MSDIHITTPLTPEAVRSLRAGDRVLISGLIYTARDSAHKRLVEALDRGEALPVDVAGQAIYYCGPTPAPPGKPIGSCGPTTSYRMDAYAPRLHALGLAASIGKGDRGMAVREACREFDAVYLVATGGAGALLAETVKAAEVVAYDDLGPEAIRRLEVEGFPALVAYDAHGGSAFPGDEPLTDVS